MAILHLQVTKIIGHMQTNLIIRNTQIHGLHFCNPRTKRIVSEGILRYTQDDIRATEIATSGTALLAMTTPCVVILNEVKNLLEADKRQRI